MDSIQRVWLNAHPANEYAAYLYTTTYMNQATVPELETQYARFSPAVQQSEYGQQIVEKIRLNQSVVKGSQAPAFTLTDVATGKAVSLSDYTADTSCWTSGVLVRSMQTSHPICAHSMKI